jgi:hypothetical protein
MTLGRALLALGKALLTLGRALLALGRTLADADSWVGLADADSWVGLADIGRVGGLVGSCCRAWDHSTVSMRRKKTRLTMKNGSEFATRRKRLRTKDVRP